MLYFPGVLSARLAHRNDVVCLAASDGAGNHQIFGQHAVSACHWSYESVLQSA